MAIYACTTCTSCSGSFTPLNKCRQKHHILPHYWSASTYVWCIEAPVPSVEPCLSHDVCVVAILHQVPIDVGASGVLQCNVM